MNRLLIGHKTAQERAVFPCEQTNVCRSLGRGVTRGLIERRRRMYIGLGTILLIVLIIVLLIWVF
jgi:hypothetical protein